MPRHIELNPTAHLTIGTVGEPGQRIFYLQGSQGDDLISLILEKQQAIILAESLTSLLAELETNQQIVANREQYTADTRLREPINPLYRVGNIGLGFSEEDGRIVIVAYELVEEEEEPSMVSFWASTGQIRALIPHAISVINAGRPLCGNCGEPIDPSGHFCPRRNGHAH